MAKVLSSISGNLISAASAGYAPTNSADVSAIASAYQVVSATGTQLYAGTAHVTSINGDPISASRAGNAANASMATSAYYDGTGRLISSLPDSATVSAIASSYAGNKADASALSSYALSADVSSTIDTVANNSASWGAGVSLPITGSVGTDSATYGETSVEFDRYDTAGEPDIRTATLSPDALNIMSTVDGNDYYSVNINENGIEFGDPDGYYSVTPYDILNWNSAVDTVANNSASWGGGGAQVVTATGSASATSQYGFVTITSYMVSSINGSALLPYGFSTLSANSANWTSTNSAVSANSAKWTSTNTAVSTNSAKWTSTNSAVSSNSANWNSAYSLISGVTALLDSI